MTNLFLYQIKREKIKKGEMMKSVKVSEKTKIMLVEKKEKLGLKSYDKVLQHILKTELKEKNDEKEVMKLSMIDLNLNVLLNSFNSYLNAIDKTILEDSKYSSTTHRLVSESVAEVKKTMHINKLSDRNE